jgi:hypothetical protein
LEGPLGFTQAFEGADDSGFVEVGDRVAVGGLIAGGDEGIESERIGVWDEDFFFEEAAEDAGLFEGERLSECGMGVRHDVKKARDTLALSWVGSKVGTIPG